MALISAEGLERLREQLKSLKEEDEVVLKAISFARSLGDFSENSELDTARNDLERIQGRIIELTNEIAEASIFDVNSVERKDVIGFGCKVILEDDNGVTSEYIIVHDSESDISNHKLSFSSPLAQAMLGKKVGDSFSFFPPAGEKNFEILSVDYFFNGGK